MISEPGGEILADAVQTPGICASRRGRGHLEILRRGRRPARRIDVGQSRGVDCHQARREDVVAMITGLHETAPQPFVQRVMIRRANSREGRIDERKPQSPARHNQAAPTRNFPRSAPGRGTPLPSRTPRRDPYPPAGRRGHLRFDHPKLRRVPGGIRILGPEGRPKGVHFRQRAGERFGFELALFAIPRKAADRRAGNKFHPIKRG